MGTVFFITRTALFFSSTTMTTTAMKYRLSADEVEQCRRIGQERNDRNVAAGVKNANYSGRNDVQISVQGLWGEWAFHKMLGLPVDDLYDTTPRNARTDTFDCRLGAHTVDVKTVLDSECPLLVSTFKQKNPANWYVLMHARQYVSEPHIDVTLVGCCSGRDLFRYQNQVVGPGGKMYYRCPREALQPWTPSLGLLT